MPSTSSSRTLARPFLSLVFLTCALLATAFTQSGEDKFDINEYDNLPRAQIAQGLIIGGVEAVSGNHYYLGVPYAASTEGNNRFRPPQPVVPASEDKPFIAHKYSETCPQGNANPLFSPVGENCLSVNIWTPPNARNLPVMVYSESTGGYATCLTAYGGAMISGSNSDQLYNGTAFASNGIIYVALNHRSNLFGFPYAKSLNGTSQNFGILDVFAAVEWVQNNIHAFGGDPDQITLFGQSSGGVMTDYYLWNHPETTIKAAIIQSANVFSGPNYAPEGIAFDRLASDIGCPIEDDQAQLECMRSRPLSDLLTSNFNTTYQTWFTPVIDNFTRYHSRDYVKRYEAGLFPKHVPVLTGNTDDEESLFSDLVYPKPLTVPFSSWAQTFEADAAHIPHSETMLHYNISQYSTEQRMSGRLYANMRFYCAVDFSVDLRSDQGNLWQYRWMGSWPEAIPSFLGAAHGAENPFIFIQFNTDKPSDDAVELSKTMQKIWTDFAKDPAAGPGWNPASPSDGPVALLGSNDRPKDKIITSADQYNAICQNFHNLWQPRYPVIMNPLDKQAFKSAGDVKWEEQAGFHFNNFELFQ